MPNDQPANGYFLNVFYAFRRKRLITLDLNAADSDLEESARELDDLIRKEIEPHLFSDSPDRFRQIWRVVLGAFIDWYRDIPGQKLVRPISLAPSDHTDVRHATRVIAMVHELHKAGYQRIRMLPYLSPSGGHWRCDITFAENIQDDGYRIREGHVDRHEIAYYSTADKNHYFGWPGAEHMSARQLAARFLQEFPNISERGRGRDWAYAGWVTEVLGRAEQGRHEDLLYLLADWEIDAATLRTWQPPPVVE